MIDRYVDLERGRGKGGIVEKKGKKKKENREKKLVGGGRCPKRKEKERIAR